MRLIALPLCLMLPAAAAACPLPTPAIQRGDMQAAWKVIGEPLVVGRHFTIDVRVCPDSALLTRVDAMMPEHRHGMNYRPSVERLGAGHWRVDGLMFHMPGRWELRLDVLPAAGGDPQQLSDTILLP